MKLGLLGVTVIYTSGDNEVAGEISALAPRGVLVTKTLIL